MGKQETRGKLDAALLHWIVHASNSYLTIHIAVRTDFW